jgi:hypothetical protein
LQSLALGSSQNSEGVGLVKFELRVKLLLQEGTKFWEQNGWA